MTTDRARFDFYCEHLAPMLTVMAAACGELGMPFAAFAEWSPGNVESVFLVPETTDVGADCLRRTAFAQAATVALFRPIWRRMAVAGHLDGYPDDEERLHVN